MMKKGNMRDSNRNKMKSQSELKKGMGNMKKGGISPDLSFSSGGGLKKLQGLKDQSNTINAQLDRVFSLYIRLNNADKDGFVRCFTCNKKLHYKEIHNGHFLTRMNLATRWEEKNCNPQCPHCNVNLKGNISKYENKLGLDVVFMLKNLTKIPTRNWIEENIISYGRKTRSILKNLR